MLRQKKLFNAWDIREEVRGDSFLKKVLHAVVFDAPCLADDPSCELIKRYLFFDEFE